MCAGSGGKRSDRGARAIMEVTPSPPPFPSSYRIGLGGERGTLFRDSMHGWEARYAISGHSMNGWEARYAISGHSMNGWEAR
jgi:hypothetical protein